MRAPTVLLDLPTCMGAIAIGTTITAYVAVRVELDALPGSKLWMIALLGPAMIALAVDQLRRNHKQSSLANTTTRTKLIGVAIAIVAPVLTWVGLAVSGFPG